jgi:Flp pilus assembly protein TadD
LRILQASDYLLANNKFEAALSILGRLLREQPRNWEALYREGVALNALDKPADAAHRFQAILEMRGSDDELSQLQAATKKQRTAATTRPTSTLSDFPLQMAPGSSWNL